MESAGGPTDDSRNAPHPAVKHSHAALIGLTAGLLGGMFGVGGGFIIVPGLTGFAKMERRRAHGTSMAATLPIAFGSVITYLAHGHVDWVIVPFLTVGSVVGAILGTHLLRIIPHRALVIMFVITVLATSTRLLIGSESTGRGDLTVLMALSMVAVGFAAGTLSGLLGIGGGVIRVPGMILFSDMAAVVAKGTSSADIIPAAIMGTFRNRKHANVDLRVAALVGSFGAAAAVLGSTIATTMSDGFSNAMFAVLLIAVAVSQLLSLRPRPSNVIIETVPSQTVTSETGTSETGTSEAG